ncbi:MAG: hypothetical protein HOW73_12030 [Polyangiaceae bacterium]|nr:hypothetical protein [Polyangiaceae bacterium]
MKLLHATGHPDGTVDYSIMPGLSGECVVTISKGGMRPVSFPLDERCSSHFGLSCTGLETTVMLTPAEGAP